MKKADEHVLQLSAAKTAKEGIDLIQLKFIMVITVVVIFMIKLTGLIWVCVNVCGCGMQGIQCHIVVVFCTCINISCCSCWVSNPWPPGESDAPPLNYPCPLIISITTVAPAERGCRECRECQCKVMHWPADLLRCVKAGVDAWGLVGCRRVRHCSGSTWQQTWRTWTPRCLGHLGRAEGWCSPLLRQCAQRCLTAQRGIRGFINA